VVWVCLRKSGCFGFLKERLGVVWICLGKAGCRMDLFRKGWVWYGFV